MRTLVINPKYRQLQNEIEQIPDRFLTEGHVIQDNRNVIKTLSVGDLLVNVKSFKKPHFINQIAYTYFRRSKAERSYTYALKLTQMGINTPEPIAYIEYKDGLLTKSFYISVQIEVDMEYRAIVHQSRKDLEPLLKAFTRFTFNMHENGVLFLDYSPGNILVKQQDDGNYSFYLVDLNRMIFRTLTQDERIANFRKLKASPRMMAIMAQEYARLTGWDYSMILKKMIKWTLMHNKRKFIPIK